MDDKDYGTAHDLKEDQAKINADHDKMVADQKAKANLAGGVAGDPEPFKGRPSGGPADDNKLFGKEQPGSPNYHPSEPYKPTPSGQPVNDTRTQFNQPERALPSQDDEAAHELHMAASGRSPPAHPAAPYYEGSPRPGMSNQAPNLEKDPADLASVLASIDGVAVGGYAHHKSLSTVAYADKHGWIARRMQALPVPPVEMEMLEITDAGLTKLRDMRGDVAEREARAQRDWYRKQDKLVTKPAV